MYKHCFPEGPSEQTETNNNLERSPVLDAGGKLEYLENNLQEQVLTGNQMDIQRCDQESNAGLLVHSVEEATLPASPKCADTTKV